MSTLVRSTNINIRYLILNISQFTWTWNSFRLISLIFGIIWFVSAYFFFKVSSIRAHLQTNLSNIIQKNKHTHWDISSVQFSRSVVSDSLWPHESHHARPPCPSPTPRVHSESCPLSQWCHPAISSSVVPFSSCPQSLPASESFPMSQLFTWGGQSSGVFSFSISPSNEYSGLISLKIDWFDLLAVQGTFKSFLQHHSSKASILRCSALFTVQLSHPYMTTGKTIALTIQTFVGKVIDVFAF